MPEINYPCGMCRQTLNEVSRKNSFRFSFVTILLW